MKFIVKKSKWLRDRTMDADKPKGWRRTDGVLLNKAGFMCCLGFCLLQSGVAKSRLRYNGMPSATGVPVSPFTTDQSGADTSLSCKAAEINDDGSTTTEDKMGKLTKLFKKYKQEIEFV